MKKKINQILNIIMGSFIGIFICSGLYKYWHFRKYPYLYAMQSAPWHTGILINGLLTLVLLAVCMIVKVILIEKIGRIQKIALIETIPNPQQSWGESCTQVAMNEVP